MWSLLLLYLFSFCANVSSNPNCQGNMANQELVQSFRDGYDAFAVKIFKTTTPRSSDYVLMSPILAYMTLIAIAEGADKSTQNEIFEILNLPKDSCRREQYYSLVLSVISKSKYLKMDYHNSLFIDKGLHLDMNWYIKVVNLFLRVIPVPLKSDPELVTELISEFVSLEAIDLDLSGNSVLISSLVYSGLWTTSFDDAIIENKPFYDQSGQQVGSVDFMTFKREIRMSDAASIFAPLIELPVSIDGEYRMFIGILKDEANLTETVISMDETAVKKMVASLLDNYKKIELSIPRFAITSTVDMKEILQDIGLKNMWQDPTSTKNISTPPAHPSSYIQSLKVDLNTKGVNPPTHEHTSDQEIEKFIANRPFAFALYHGKTFANIFVGSYIKPSQSNN